MCLKYEFPLSKVTGKIRIKERFAFSDYGIPVPPTKTTITPKHYIEWQIGYDRVVDKDENHHFIGANGNKKQIYELSKFLEFGLNNNFISLQDLQKLRDNIQNNNCFIENLEKIFSHEGFPWFSNQNYPWFTPCYRSLKISELEFLRLRVSYPLFIYKFSQDMWCEIIIREKQYARKEMKWNYLSPTFLFFSFNLCGHRGLNCTYRALNAKKCSIWRYKFKPTPKFPFRSLTLIDQFFEILKSFISPRLQW